jgi:hypothetical protein
MQPANMRAISGPTRLRRAQLLIRFYGPRSEHDEKHQIHGFAWCVSVLLSAALGLALPARYGTLTRAAPSCWVPQQLGVLFLLMPATFS